MTSETQTRIVIREAIPADAEVLAALMAEMDDEPLRSTDAAKMKEVLTDMAKLPDFRAYLAFDENGIAVGSFSLMIFSSPSHHGTRQALLDAVVVTRSQRGRGVGEAMLAQALKLATAFGCYKMMLSSNLKRVDAHRFYERLGFNQHGISFSIPINQAATSE